MHDKLRQRKTNELLQLDETDKRPVLLFLAGPNGAGKSSLFDELDGLIAGRDFVFINADSIGKLVDSVPSSDVLAQKVADLAREHMLSTGVDFATESVFSDEVGAKLGYLKRAAEAGFHVVFVFVALASLGLSIQRVRHRVAHGGHDVPMAKLARRFVASKENARRAFNFVETCILIDNSSIAHPLRRMATIKHGTVISQFEDMPGYLQDLLPMEPGASSVKDAK